jgi:hypothetical protein
MDLFFQNKKKYETDEALADLQVQIKAMKSADLTDREKQELRNIMLALPDNRLFLRDDIAILLSDTGDVALLPDLIRLVRANIHDNHLGSLVYACGQYDCYQYPELFVDVFLLRQHMTALDAFTVLQKIKSPVDAETRQYCINKLKAFLELLEPEHSRYKNVQAAIDLLDTMKVKTTDTDAL